MSTEANLCGGIMQKAFNAIAMSERPRGMEGYLAEQRKMESQGVKLPAPEMLDEHTEPEEVPAKVVAPDANGKVFNPDGGFSQAGFQKYPEQAEELAGYAGASATARGEWSARQGDKGELGRTVVPSDTGLAGYSTQSVEAPTWSGEGETLIMPDIQIRDEDTDELGDQAASGK